MTSDSRNWSAEKNRRGRLGAVAISVSCAVVGVVCAVSGATAAGTWGQATPALFAAGVQSAAHDDVGNSVSCASVGNCTVTGLFKNAAGNKEGMVISSTDGVWGQATPIAFAAGVQNAAPFTNPTSVSCASAGSCTVVGQFKNAAGYFEAFTVTSTNGVWGQAAAVNFAAGAQFTNPDAVLMRVICVSAGNCSAVGYFLITGALGREAFTVSSTNGVWGQAASITFGAGVQNSSHESYFSDLSCVSAGNCSAVGQFKNPAGGFAPFTASSTSGVWGQATPVAFAAGVQNSLPNDFGQGVSCASAGNCTATGKVRTVAGGYEAYVVSSTSGVWGQAALLTFAAGVQSASPNDLGYKVSCPSVGNCSVIGKFKNATGGYEAFAASSTSGVWGQATPVAFSAGVQSTTRDDAGYAISCPSDGNCSAVGQFKNAAGGYEAFTVSSTSGAWGQAARVVFAAGIQNTTSNDSGYSVSCASSGNCAVTGPFKNAAGGIEAFVVSQVDSSSTATTTSVATTTTAAATTTIASTTTAPAATTSTTVAGATFAMKVRQTTTLGVVLTKLRIAIPSKASLVASSRSTKTCVVSGQSVRAVSAGTCLLSVKIIPPPTKAVPKPKAPSRLIKITVTG